MTADKVIVGDNRANDFILPADGLSEQFEMFRRSGKQFSVRVSDALDGKIKINGEESTLEAAISSGKLTKVDSIQTAGGKSAQVYETTIQPGDWGVIELGGASMFYQMVEPSDEAGRLMPWALVGLTGMLALALFLSAFGHGAFLLECFRAYDPTAELDTYSMPDRFVRFIAQEPADQPEVDEEIVEPDEDTAGKKAGGEEGKFGAEDSDVPDSKVPKTDSEMVNKVDANNIGITKALGSNVLGRGPLSKVFGDMDGFDAKMGVAMSGEGNVLQVGRGSGGMGLRGTNTGGGGEGYGRVHGLGRMDNGGGKGVKAKIGGRAKTKVKTVVTRGTPNVGQFCAKSNISAVVGRGSGGIKYCYENELQTNPNLAGKVTLSWTVNLQGQVLKAFVASSSLNNKSVESCMTRQVKRWRFDPPKGGHCIIQYPFTFKGAQ